MIIRHNRQDAFVGLFYGFSGQDSRFLTETLDSITQNMFLGEEFKILEENISDSASLSIERQSKYGVLTGDSDEIMLISRNKKKVKSCPNSITFILLLVVSFILLIISLFLLHRLFKINLGQFTVMRKFNESVSFISTGGSIVDTIFKLGIRNPRETYRFNPAIAVIYFRMQDFVRLMSSATREIVTNFDFDP